jgi:hypothetical protein
MVPPEDNYQKGITSRQGKADLFWRISTIGDKLAYYAKGITEEYFGMEFLCAM